MLNRIHFLHEILLNLLISCRKNKVSYHVFLLLLLVHEVYIENQEPRIEKSDWSIQTNYALNRCMQYIINVGVTYLLLGSCRYAVDGVQIVWACLHTPHTLTM